MKNPDQEALNRNRETADIQPLPDEKADQLSGGAQGGTEQKCPRCGKVFVGSRCECGCFGIDLHFV